MTAWLIDGAEVPAHVVRALVDDEVHLGDDPAERERARDDSTVQLAVVRQVRVARDDDVDRGIEQRVDPDDGARDAVARVDGARSRRLRPALVQEHDDRLDALPLQLGDERVGGLGLVQEAPALDPGLSDERVGVLQRHADEADLHALDLLDPVRRKRRLAGGVVDGVRGEPLEVRSGVGRTGEVTPVDGMAATVLHAEELGDALVELVVADARHVEAHCVQRLDGRLVVEQARQERRAPDEVAGSDGEAVLLAGAELSQLRGEVLAAARERAGDVTRAGIRVRLQVPVVVVEPEQLNLDQLTGRICARRCSRQRGCDTDGEHGDGQDYPARHAALDSLR